VIAYNPAPATSGAGVDADADAGCGAIAFVGMPGKPVSLPYSFSVEAAQIYRHANFAFLADNNKVAALTNTFPVSYFCHKLHIY